MNLSREALGLLRRMLAREFVDQVREGRGDEEMPDPWLEIYALTDIPSPREECPYTFGHTSQWCGNEGCRES